MRKIISLLTIFSLLTNLLSPFLASPVFATQSCAEVASGYDYYLCSDLGPATNEHGCGEAGTSRENVCYYNINTTTSTDCGDNYCRYYNLDRNCGSNKSECEARCSSSGCLEITTASVNWNSLITVSNQSSSQNAFVTLSFSDTSAWVADWIGPGKSQDFSVKAISGIPSNYQGTVTVKSFSHIAHPEEEPDGPEISVEVGGGVPTLTPTKPLPPPPGTPTPTLPPAPSCTLSASPNPCTVPSGESLCTSAISWTTNDNINIYVDDGSGEKLFASSGPCFIKCSQDAPWIQLGKTYAFRGKIKGVTQCYISVSATKPSPPPPKEDTAPITVQGTVRIEKHGTFSPPSYSVNIHALSQQVQTNEDDGTYSITPGLQIPTDACYAANQITISVSDPNAPNGKYNIPASVTLNDQYCVKGGETYTVDFTLTEKPEERAKAQEAGCEDEHRWPVTKKSLIVITNPSSNAQPAFVIITFSNLSFFLADWYKNDGIPRDVPLSLPDIPNDYEGIATISSYNEIKSPGTPPDGQCILAKAAECVDTDGGLDLAVPGSCSDAHSTLYDACCVCLAPPCNCPPTTHVWEAQCTAWNNCVVDIHDCPAGTECRDGACVVPGEIVNVVGRIMNQETASNIQGAEIFIDRQYQGTSDQWGLFDIKNVPKTETHHVKVTAEGYATFVDSQAQPVGSLTSETTHDLGGIFLSPALPEAQREKDLEVLRNLGVEVTVYEGGNYAIRYGHQDENQCPDKKAVRDLVDRLYPSLSSHQRQSIVSSVCNIPPPPWGGTPGPGKQPYILGLSDEQVKFVSFIGEMGLLFITLYYAVPVGINYLSSTWNQLKASTGPVHIGAKELYTMLEHGYITPEQYGEGLKKTASPILEISDNIIPQYVPIDWVLVADDEMALLEDIVTLQERLFERAGLDLVPSDIGAGDIKYFYSSIGNPGYSASAIYIADTDTMMEDYLELKMLLDIPFGEGVGPIRKTLGAHEPIHKVHAFNGMGQTLSSFESVGFSKDTVNGLREGVTEYTARLFLYQEGFKPVGWAYEKQVAAVGDLAYIIINAGYSEEEAVGAIMDASLKNGNFHNIYDMISWEKFFEWLKNMPPLIYGPEMLIEDGGGFPPSPFPPSSYRDLSGGIATGYRVMDALKGGGDLRTETDATIGFIKESILLNKFLETGQITQDDVNWANGFDIWFEGAPAAAAAGMTTVSGMVQESGLFGGLFSLVPPAYAALFKGKVIPGAKIVVEGGGKTYSTTTDENGLFSLEVPGGVEYKITISAPGYKTFTTTFKPLGDNNYEIVAELDKGSPEKMGGKGEIEAKTGEIELTPGWNLVSLNIEPTTAYTASSALKEINLQGGKATVISKWVDGRWETYTQGIGGDDFQLELGEAHMIKSEVNSTWTINGEEIKEPISLNLEEGWNGMGVPKSEADYNALIILDSINKGEENATEISRWQSGLWDVFVKRIYSPENIQKYGNNFPIERTRGYMIRLKKGVRWTP